MELHITSIHSSTRGREERTTSGAEEDVRLAGDSTTVNSLYPNKEAIAATFLKLDRFNERLADIRSQLADRHRDELQPRARFDPLHRHQHNHHDDHNNGNATPPVASELQLPTTSSDPIRLPLLPNAKQLPRASVPISDASHLLSMDALHTREVAKAQYDASLERVRRAEASAAVSVQEADRLTEDARIAMVLYTQNEKSWNFDERAKRYQNVMQAKKEAESARLQADDDRIMVHCLRGRLADPYGPMRTRSGVESRGHDRNQVTMQKPLAPLDRLSGHDTVLVWILAAPLLTLPFTPRDETAGSVLEGEKELSTHVVYYAASSVSPVVSVATTADDPDDRPPADGWLCCSHHGVAPAPCIAVVKSALETRIVSGAGAAHVNGKYIYSGTHNGTVKFKSPSGVELFRKRLPKSSTIVQGLFDAVTTVAKTNEPSRPSARDGGEASGNLSDLVKQQQQLPSTLQALEQSDRDFKSMEKIGAWMSSDELSQKRRRLRDAEFQKKSDRHDGDHVHTQETTSQRLSPDDVAPSRPQASAELCREWVLFMRCSRRIGHLATDAPPRNLGLGCLKRHYYISTEEKENLTTWANEQEAWLEKDVLSAIVRREAHVARLTQQSRKCMSKFQQNLHHETHQAVHRMLLELNTIRFLTVKVLEAIEAWRAHARKRGFTRYEASAVGDAASQQQAPTTTLGWSACITVNTGRQLFKGSKAFVSKFKRFCRPEDPRGQQERRLVYLGYFATRDEAEQAYDAFANAEAQRLNTTVAHLPRRRNMFRSCGKHFAVESERLGPDYCIECKAKQLSTARVGGSNNDTSTAVDEWNPPFYFTPGQNYILHLASDLDFLDQILPLKSRLNNAASTDSGDLCFPLLGNVFLLAKTPMEDPTLAFFASLHASGQSLPRLGGGPRSNQEEDADTEESIDEALDADRVLRAQQIFLQEMQIYHPELFAKSSVVTNQTTEDQNPPSLRTLVKFNPDKARRIVSALYWDRCAALRIQQERSPLAFRQDGIWCRPDVGEWASFLVRGKHRQHVMFETKLAKAGKEMQERRKQALKTIRKLLKTPLYFVPSRDVIVAVIAEGELVKGDVVMLEVKSASKYLAKYDSWCVQSVVVQRWYRGVRGRRRARARRCALMLSCRHRKQYQENVSHVAHQFYNNIVVPRALQAAVKKIQRPAYTRAVKMNGERVIISIHAASSHRQVETRDSSYGDHKKQPHRHGVCCRTCARRFHVVSQYDAQTRAFHVGSTVCCCSLNHPVSSTTERWMVRAYNPQSNVMYRVNIDNRLLVQLLGTRDIKTSNPLTEWNPLRECKALSEALNVVTNMGNYVDRVAASARDEARNWQILSDEATQRRKTAEIELERSKTRVCELTARFGVAIEDARLALDFASRPFHEAQAWDPLENANDWRLIIQKRHTQKELAACIEDADHCRIELFQATASENFLRVRATDARIAHESHWRVLREKSREKVTHLAVSLEAKKVVARQAMVFMCTTQLTLRDAFLTPIRRSLVVAPAAWLRTDAAMQRMQMISIPGLRRGQDTIRRRALLLTNLATKGNQRRQSKRLIVDVSAWPNAASEKRDVWLTAYDPVSTTVERVYLDWELVQLLAVVPSRSKRHPQLDNTQEQQQSDRSGWLLIADRLLALCMLDRFTGAFTLQKLQFFHHLRLLRPQFQASKWFQDLRRGRKCGDGDEIFRQASTVDGRLCFVVVYENWGDLTLCVYHSRSATSYRLGLTVNQIFDLLAQKPLALHLWVCCVKSNTYVAALLPLLLKFVSFRDDRNELVVMEVVPPCESQSNAGRKKKDTRISLATTIQGRRLLVTYRDTIGGDLAIDAYDLTHSKQTFHLRLEWETIRTALHASGASEIATGSRRRNLTLARNRRELCEWISSRLRFQSLLEHPDVLASSSSPFMSGVQVRTSFSLFNDWVLTSMRNPLDVVPPSDIDKYAACADATLFQGLAHEQLAFVPQARLPFGDEKRFIETRDFLVNDRASPQLQHLKMDLYTHSHRLYARVRRELQHEMAKRLEQSERQQMEQEQLLALRDGINQSCITLTKELTKCSSMLQGLCDTIAARQDAWAKVYEKLKKRTTTPVETKELDAVSSEINSDIKKKKTKKLTTSKKLKDPTAQNTRNAVDMRLVLTQLLGCVRCQEDATYIMLHSQRGWLSGTLRSLASQLITVATTLEETVCIPFRAFCEATQAVTEATDNGENDVDSVSGLVESRSGVLRFLESLDANDLMPDAEIYTNHQGTPVGDNQAAGVDIDSASNATVYSTADDTVATAVTIPPTGATEEVAIDSSYAHTMKLFTQWSTSLLSELMPLFARPSSGKRDHRAAATVALQANRVPGGVVVFQQPSSSSSTSRRHAAQWNARASALAMEPVLGIAVFVPAAFTTNFHRADLFYQSLTEQQTSAAADRSSSRRATATASVAARRPKVQRAKQLLPWKQFSVERMQTTRKLRHQRARAGLLIEQIASDTERDSATLATYETSERIVEWKFGDDTGTVQTLATLAASSLRLVRKSEDAHGQQWGLALVDEHRMHHLFHGDQEKLLPSDGLSSQLSFGHLRVEAADDWRHPRRFVFSCRELHTRQQYFVDRSYAQLKQLMMMVSTRSGKNAEDSQDLPLHWPLEQLPAEQWRLVAKTAAEQLSFRRQNGALALVFTLPSPVANPFAVELDTAVEAAIGSEVPDTTTIHIVDALPPPTPVLRFTKRQAEVQEWIYLCRSRRFRKHQSLVRRAALLRQCEAIADTMAARRLSLEWLRMTQEDWRSQEYRGVLTLDDKELKKLTQAFVRVTTKSGSGKIKKTDTEAVAACLSAIDKEMATKPTNPPRRYDDEANRFQAKMKRNHWWKDKHDDEEGHALVLDMADVAEWWRQQSRNTA